MAFDIYTEVTDRIIAEMEQGIIPWEKPWTGTSSGAIRHVGGRPYSILNQMLLGKPGEYLTFDQAKKEGGNVKKGAKSKLVVFWKFIERTKTDAKGNIVYDENGLPRAEAIPYLRYYRVFHIDDCEGIKPKWDKEVHNDIKPIETAQQVLDGYIAREGIKLEHVKGNEAFYRPATDEINLPLMEQFDTINGYYDTAFHESVHSTGHPKRLNRQMASALAPFGSEDYSKEELVAEIGACGIMHELGLETEKTFRNNAAYIQSWLKALKNDKRMIVSAAGKAEKAIDRIFNRNTEAKSGDNSEI